MKSNPTFRPMRACDCPPLDQIRFPVMVSCKLDGIRAIMRNGKLVSNTLKPIRNKYTQEKFAFLPDGLDGELIVGEPYHPDAYVRTMAGVMSVEGTPDVSFHVFDWHREADPIDAPFRQRYDDIVNFANPLVSLVPHYWAYSVGKLQDFESDAIDLGYEGVMVRDPNGIYKFGRSTVKEGGLMKLKRSHDAEAVIIGDIERMHNGNEATIDERGLSKRSQAKAGKTGTGSLGAWQCRSLVNGVTFEVGTGLSEIQRYKFWETSQVGRTIKYKYMALTAEGKPRQPVFIGFRDPADVACE